MYTSALFARQSLLAFAILGAPFAVLAQSATGGNPLSALPNVPAAPAQASVPLQVNAPSSGVQDALNLVIQITRVDVQGVSAIPFEEVSALLAPLSGHQRTVGELMAIAQKITDLYTQKGYALSFAYLPPQDFAGGVVRVNVVEGYIARLELEGDAGRSETLIRELVEPLLTEKPLTAATFQRQTQLMTRLPGIEIAATANLPTTTDGATPLIIKAKHKPIVVSVGGEIRKPTPRAVATVLLNDPLWQGSQFQLTTLLRNPDQERFIALTFSQMLNAKGTMLRSTYSDYRSVNDALTRQPGLDDTTLQRKLDVGIVHPWIIAGNEQLSTTVGIYGVNYGKDYLYHANQLNIQDEEKLRALYGQVNWFKASNTMAQTASAMVAKGINSLGAGLHRANNQGLGMVPNLAELDFLRITADYTQRHRFSNKLGAAFGVGGQYTHNILPAPERTSFGSSRFGRGYAPGEFSGDSGLGGSVELNYQFITGAKWLQMLEPYVLYEQARTRFETAGASGNTLKSVALGLRLADNRYYSLDVSAAKALGDRSPNNPDRALRYSLMLSYNLNP